MGWGLLCSWWSWPADFIPAQFCSETLLPLLFCIKGHNMISIGRLLAVLRYLFIRYVLNKIDFESIVELIEDLPAWLMVIATAFRITKYIFSPIFSITTYVVLGLWNSAIITTLVGLAVSVLLWAHYKKTIKRKMWMWMKPSSFLIRMAVQFTQISHC